MCKDVGTTECSGDCGTCKGAKLQAPDAHKRLAELDDISGVEEPPVMGINTTPRNHQ